MISAELVREVLGVYRKHEWTPVKLLLRKPSAFQDGELDDVLGEIEIESANVDAVWFERPSTKGRTAIELRLLQETPYAIFELLEADASDDAVLETKNRIVHRLFEYASKKPE